MNLKFLKTPSVRLVLFGCVLGVAVLTISIYSIQATDKRPFCASCHIMDTAAITQKMSTHANIACTECHLPNNWAKLPAKAYTGTIDVYYNFFGTVELPIKATKFTKDIVNDNCIRCHTMSNLNVASMAVKPYCSDCHVNVPHNQHKPISTRMVAHE